MRDKYINFFKKQIVFLSILLVIVCFSFGITYSNFIYNSDSHRAVEMFAGSLEYELSINNKTNEVKLKPGNNIIHLKVKSLNEVNTYFKLVYDNDYVNIRFFNFDNNVIRSNEELNIDLIVFNKKNENVNLKIEIIGGYITNTYDDVIVKDNKKVIVDKLSVGDIVTINNEVYRLLGVNEDGTYELVSDVMENSSIIYGALGYNNYIDTINNVNINMNNIVKVRNINVEDIEKYTKKKIVDYKSSYYYSNSYYPILWTLEEDAIINNIAQDYNVSRSEGSINENKYEYASSITVRKLELNELEFVSDKYKELFTGSYMLATRYQTSQGDKAVFGVLSIEDGKINQNPLFDSNAVMYECNGNNKLIITVNGSTDIFTSSL